MTTKPNLTSASLALLAAACAALSSLAAAGCSAGPPPQEKVVIAPPPASAAPSLSASAVAPPAPTPSAAPQAAPTPAAVDRETCHSHSPAVTFEVTNDDIVIPLDAAGCPLGESHFKPNGYSYKASVDFMTELQRLLKAGDKKGLSELVSYPLRVNSAKAKKGTVTIKDRAAFLREFDGIYSPAVIEEALKHDPRYIFCNYQGVMLGNGIVWATNEKGGRLGVFVINVP